MGPLSGIKIIEMAGIGPVPFCSMQMADMGAEVLSIDRVVPHGLGLHIETRFDLLKRGRRSVAVDLKNPRGVETVLRLVEQADVILEGFRPGVMERLGLAPEVCMERNPRLVYGRMTGWGQSGPMATEVGHDINYISLSGALSCIGEKGGKPVPPLNLVGDFGGGALFLAFGVVSALLEASKSGKGQVVDVSMTEGAATLMTPFYGWNASGNWNEARGTNSLDGGSHFYNVYETADGKFISVGSIEPKFYAELLTRIGLADEELPEQNDRKQWPGMIDRLSQIFKQHTRDEWCEIMKDGEICFAPVLTLDEVKDHPHNAARGSFVEVDGVVQPAPAPRFSRTQPEMKSPPFYPGQHTEEGLADWGFTEEDIRSLKDDSAIMQA